MATAPPARAARRVAGSAPRGPPAKTKSSPPPPASTPSGRRPIRSGRCAGVRTRRASAVGARATRRLALASVRVEDDVRPPGARRPPAATQPVAQEAAEPRACRSARRARAVEDGRRRRVPRSGAHRRSSSRAQVRVVQRARLLLGRRAGIVHAGAAVVDGLEPTRADGSRLERGDDVHADSAARRTAAGSVAHRERSLRVGTRRSTSRALPMRARRAPRWSRARGPCCSEGDPETVVAGGAGISVDLRQVDGRPRASATRNGTRRCRRGRCRPQKQDVAAQALRAGGDQQRVGRGEVEAARGSTRARRPHSPAPAALSGTGRLRDRRRRTPRGSGPVRSAPHGRAP